MSIKEPTRIRIEGAAITDVFGNLYSSSCGALPAAAGAAARPRRRRSIRPGELVLECDRDKGEIYIRPVGDRHEADQSVHLQSRTRTYTLLLRRADTPADTIVIRDKTPRQVQPGQRRRARSRRASPNHIRALKTMLVAMASDRVPPDVRVEELDRPVAALGRGALQR
ncbi:MAG: type-F conjugative transfer system secretin TraK [Comamonadaceae bacterium]|nr:type-F conjugative transfer system secretin TraK [Comamonadaceae bacterium]